MTNQSPSEALLNTPGARPDSGMKAPATMLRRIRSLVVLVIVTETVVLGSAAMYLGHKEGYETDFVNACNGKWFTPDRNPSACVTDALKGRAGAFRTAYMVQVLREGSLEWSYSSKRDEKKWAQLAMDSTVGIEDREWKYKFRALVPRFLKNGFSYSDRELVCIANWKVGVSCYPYPRLLAFAEQNQS